LIANQLRESADSDSPTLTGLASKLAAFFLEHLPHDDGDQQQQQQQESSITASRSSSCDKRDVCSLIRWPNRDCGLEFLDAELLPRLVGRQLPIDLLEDLDTGAAHVTKHFSCSSSTKQRCREVVQAVLLATADAVAQLLLLQQQQQQQGLTAAVLEQLTMHAKLSAVFGLTHVIAAIFRAEFGPSSLQLSQQQQQPAAEAIDHRVVIVYDSVLEAAFLVFFKRRLSISLHISLWGEDCSAHGSVRCGAHNAHEQANSSTDAAAPQLPTPSGNSSSSSSSSSVAAAAERPAVLGRSNAPTARLAGSSMSSRSRAKPRSSRSSAAAGSAKSATAEAGFALLAAAVPADELFAFCRKFCSLYSADHKDEVGTR
jgi:hypothetical protein